MVSNRGGRLRAVVGDFGLTQKSGGTSIFMAPEGLNKDSRVVEKTDLYSFSVMVLFLMFPAELAIKLLFFPIEENCEELIESLSRFPLLLWIINSLVSDPEDRADFDSWKVIIQEMKNFDKDWLLEKIGSEILETNGIDLSLLNKAVEKEGDLNFFIINYFGYEIGSSKVNKNKAYEISKAVSRMENLSLLPSNAQLGTISIGQFQGIISLGQKLRHAIFLFISKIFSEKHEVLVTRKNENCMFYYLSSLINDQY